MAFLAAGGASGEEVEGPGLGLVPLFLVLALLPPTVGELPLVVEVLLLVVELLAPVVEELDCGVELLPLVVELLAVAVEEPGCDAEVLSLGVETLAMGMELLDLQSPVVEGVCQPLFMALVRDQSTATIAGKAIGLGEGLC